jgi:YD repeat-containing protein
MLWETAGLTITVILETGLLYAKVTLPGGHDVYFDLIYDGSYQAKAGSAYTLDRDSTGFHLSDRNGTVYDFSDNGLLERISYLDGNTISLSYNGDQLTRISNDTGSFALSYNSEGNLETVTDSTGRSILLSYDGDSLISAENPDGDSLRYTYENGLLATVQNFKGEVYVENTYDSEGRVIHQYAADIGTFDFTYDPENRRNTSIIYPSCMTSLAASLNPPMRMVRKNSATTS